MIFDWGRPNHKSHAMTSSETSKEEFFVGAKISQNGRSEAVAWCWHVTSYSFKGESLNKSSVYFSRGGVEVTRLEAKAKDTKNIRGQGQPFRESLKC